MKFNIGDRVEVTIVGDVEVTPAGDFLQLSNGVHLWTKTPDIQIRKVARRKPMVGEVIDAARLKATPWKRGTVIKGTIFADPTLGDTEDHHWQHLLQANGKWREDSGEDVSFREMGTFDQLEVVYLP